MAMTAMDNRGRVVGWGCIYYVSRILAETPMQRNRNSQKRDFFFSGNQGETTRADRGEDFSLSCLCSVVMFGFSMKNDQRSCGLEPGLSRMLCEPRQPAHAMMRSVSITTRTRTNSCMQTNLFPFKLACKHLCHGYCSSWGWTFTSMS
jgi:hypothetical protein